MTQTRFDVLTIGNAIVDIIAPVEPGFIEREGMKEGIMHLIDTDRAEDLYGKMPLGRQQISGGSAANTAAGVASLGGRAAYRPRDSAFASAISFFTRSRSSALGATFTNRSQALTAPATSFFTS